MPRHSAGLRGQEKPKTREWKQWARSQGAPGASSEKDRIHTTTCTIPRLLSLPRNLSVTLIEKEVVYWPVGMARKEEVARHYMVRPRDRQT